MSVRNYPKVNRGSALEAALDVLDADGGWLTTQGLHHEITQRGFQIEFLSLQTMLYRAQTRGLVESRRLELAKGLDWNAQDIRVEWKFA